MERPPIGPENYFIAAGEGSRKTPFPGVNLVTNAGNRLMLSMVHLEPHSVVFDHEHPHEQMGLLISGKLEFTIGDVTKVLSPGDMWRIPGGVRHKVVTLDEPAVALDVFHPIREDYL